MLKCLSSFIFTIIFSHVLMAQELTSEHEILPGNLPSEFTIKTTVTGLVGADLARIKYFIPKTHTYKASPNNQFFSKIEEDYVKFYIMSIPTSGVVIIELGVVLASEGSFTFPVEFQYSKNEEKIVFECKPLVIENGGDLITEELTLNEKIQVETAKEEAALEEEKKLKAAEELADALAAQKKAEEDAELAAKIEQVRAIAKQEEEAERLALEKEKADALAKKEAAAALLTEKKEKEVKTEVNTGVKYGVQIFALSKYTEQKVRDFCKRNNLDYALISTLETKGITKIRYGAVNSKPEAEALKKELLTRPQINGGFVVKVSN